MALQCLFAWKNSPSAGGGCSLAAASAPGSAPSAGGCPSGGAPSVAGTASLVTVSSTASCPSAGGAASAGAASAPSAAAGAAPFQWIVCLLSMWKYDVFHNN